MGTPHSGRAALMFGLDEQIATEMDLIKCSGGSVVKGSALLLLFMMTSLSTTAKAGTGNAPEASITYRFEPVTINEKPAFHVRVRFRTAGPVTAIVEPTRWGSAQHLDGQTQNLKVLTPGATLEDSAELGRKELHARPNERVELAYDIVPLQTEWFGHPQEHMAIINSDYFLFNTENALVYPSF